MNKEVSASPTGCEVWKDIPGYEGYYEVSDQGRVRSLDRVVTFPERQRRKPLGRDKCVRHKAHSRVMRGRIMQPTRRPSGHMSVCLFSQSVQSAEYVHRLVLRAFVGPCPDGQETLHLNHDPTDNRLCNLKYGTHLENVRMDRERRLLGLLPGYRQGRSPRAAGTAA